MKCKVCNVKFDKKLLVDGRCRGCRRALEATQRGIHYGDFISEIDPPKAVTAQPERMIAYPPRETGIQPDTMHEEAKHKCMICGKPIPNYRTGKTCCGDPECINERDRMRARQRYEKKKIPGLEEKANCQVCGKEFPVSKSFKVVCSTECRRTRRLEQTRRYFKEKHEREKQELFEL